MKKAMLSQPMAGKSEAEIIATREQVIRVLKERGYEVVGWEQARGCQIEHAAAVAYGLEIIYEEDDEEGDDE